MDKPDDVRLVASRRALSEAASLNAPSHVYGRARTAEGLIQILACRADEGAAFEEVGTIRLGFDHASGGVRVVLGSQDLTIVFRADLPLPSTVTIVDVASEMASRGLGLVPDGGLREKTILLVGAGSIGSQVGVLLAQAGVGRFHVIDHDSLDGANVARHSCDLTDLGRRKALAVAELLTRREASAWAHDRDVRAIGEEELTSLIRESDLVVASTDSMPAQFTVNDGCILERTPGVFVGAYDEAAAGEVLVVRPGVGPCLFCAVGFRTTIAGNVGVKERRQAYRAPNVEGFIAEPGLGLDIAYLATVAAAHVLALLDPTGRRAELIRPGREFLLFHGGSTPRNGPAELFDQPFEFIHARVLREDPCPVCGWATNGQEHQ